MEAKKSTNKFRDKSHFKIQTSDHLSQSISHSSDLVKMIRLSENDDVTRDDNK